MARMLDALKNLEAKEARPQSNRAPAPPVASTVAKSASVAAASMSTSGISPVAPRVIEAVDKLDAVVGHELGNFAASTSAPAFGPRPDFAFADFAFLGQPKTGAAVLPPVSQQPQQFLPAPATKAPCDLERQVKRALSDPLRSQPVVELADRLIRDMEQTESKTLAFVGLGTSGDSHSPLLHAATLLAEKRSKKVLLIDGDLARRSLSDGLENGRVVGLGELIAGKAEAGNCRQPTAVAGLSFLAAGQIGPVAESTATEAIERALGQLKGGFDCVLIDAGDAGGVNSSALASECDATYLVVELGAVDTNAAQAALARLRAAGARILGCIAT